MKRFVFISVHDYKLPKPVSNIGYIAGKREVEKEMGELFHDQGYVLRPAFIYGDRKLALPTDEQKKINLPLQRLGSMAENVRILCVRVCSCSATNSHPIPALHRTVPS